MDRRSFLAASSAGLASSTLARPAIAQSSPEIRWRLTSSFPKTLDTLFGVSVLFAKTLDEITDGKFQVEAFAAGEIVPGLQALDAVQNATVEMAHTPSFYYWGKDPAFAFGTALPFGLNQRQQNAWLFEAGGMDLLNELFAKYNVFGIPMGSTGAQMGGWFRKEIHSVADLKGLKMRIGGLAGRVVSKLDVIPQQIAASDVYPSLERGVIDAAEWIGPYDDLRLGFHNVAPYYYYPGWWEGSSIAHLMINIEQWSQLSKNYQAAVRAAAAQADVMMLARYDARNPTALRQLVSEGAILRTFPLDVLEASHRAAFELYEEMALSSPNFKKLYDSWFPFRDQEYLWFRVAENTFENFVYLQHAKG